jgi:hypothetical protein
MDEAFSKNADAFSFFVANIDNFFNREIMVQNNDKIESIVISTENGPKYTLIVNYKDPEIGAKEIFFEKPETYKSSIIKTLFKLNVKLSDLLYS